MNFPTIVSLALGLVLAENLVLAQGLGVRPMLNAPTRLRTSLLLSALNGVALIAASLVSWALGKCLFAPNGIEPLLTPAAVTVMILLELLLDLLLTKLAPALRSELGANLHLYTLNTATLGAALTLTGSMTTLAETVLASAAAAAGLLLAALLFHSLRSYHRFTDHPRSFDGLPLALISAGLVALVLTGFVF